MATSVRVLRLRIKDKHAPWLRELAGANGVNLCWNYCVDLAVKIFERERRFVGSAELQRHMAGASKSGVSASARTICQVAEEFVARRRHAKKIKLAWRKSGGVRRSLGWIPFKTRSLKYEHGQIRFHGQWLGLWDSYGLADYELRGGNFSEDARGCWYLNVCVQVEIPEQPATPAGAVLRGEVPSVGIDLGLKELAALSTGEKIEAQRFYRELEPALAVAQRANKAKRVRAIHAKIANRRKDHLHKLSYRLARSHAAIFVGNVNAATLARTRLGKSVLDASWTTFRTMLRYKCADAGAWFAEVDEAFSTQTCSACFARSGPRGLQGLGVRDWICPGCGAVHDRDVNSGRNILAAGHRRLAEGIPSGKMPNYSLPA